MSWRLERIAARRELLYPSDWERGRASLTKATTNGSTTSAVARAVRSAAWTVPASSLRDLWLAISERRLVGRATLAATIYAGAALVGLAMVVLARRALAPEPLRILLSYLVIVTISAGLEPGTAKAAALAKGGRGLPPAAAVLMVSALKAILAALVLAAIWKVSAPGVPTRILLLTPLIVIAGFCTTDLRVMMDLDERHTRAMAFKQVSTVASVVMATLMMLAGLSAFWAILAASLFRLAMLVPPMLRSPPLREALAGARAILKDRRWLELAGASALSSMAGSIDRLFALHDLPAAALGGYYVTFEILSRFWLLPYLLVPILFARRVRGEVSGGFLRAAWVITAVTGAAFISGLILIALIRPAFVVALTGRQLDSASVALAAAILISSLSQLRVAELQAAGQGLVVICVLSLSLAASFAIFGILTPYYGVAGLMWGWTLRTSLEFLGMRFAPLVLRVATSRT